MSGPYDEIDPTDDATPASPSDMELEMLAALREGQTEAFKVPPLDDLMAQFRELNQTSWLSLPPGERIRYLGDYELIEELGRGGMGIVYRARQLSLHRDVAVKMVLAAAPSPALLLKRFRTETQASAKLVHPNIVPVYEVGEHDGQPYFSMRLIPGTNLAGAKARWRIDHPALEAAECRARCRGAALLVETLARAMHHAHQHGVLHRDLKPSNVLIDEDGQPYITDFGLAKLLDAPSDATATGAILGTPVYMAPEQARGGKDVTTAVDVYGLGAVLYEVVTGEPPFAPGNSAETLRLVCETEPVRPRTRVPHLDRDLETICLKCLARERNDRYASAHALAEDLRRYRHDEPILARPASLFERLRKWSRRKPAAALLVLVCLAGSLALAAGLVASNVLISAARRETEADLICQNRATYLKTVALAYRELSDHNPGRALHLLDQCAPDLRDWEWHYTKRRAEGTYRSFSQGRPKTFDVAYSPDGRYLVSLACDLGDSAPYYRGASLVVFDAATGDKLRSLDSGDVSLDWLSSWWWSWIAFSRDSRQVALFGSTSADGVRHGVVRRWDVTTGRPLPVVPASFPEREIAGTVFDLQGNCFAVSRPLHPPEARDETVLTQVHNLETGALQCEFMASCRQGSPQLSPDGRWLALGCGGVDVMDFATGQRVVGIPLPRASRRLAFAQDGTRLASVDNAGTLRLHNLPSGSLDWSVPAHQREATGLAFARDDTELVTVGVDGIIKRWQAADGQALESLTVPTVLLSVAVHPRTNEIAFALSGGEIAVWRPDQDVALQERGNDKLRYPQQIEATADGRRIVALESAEHVTVWDTAQRSVVHRLHAATTPAESISFISLSPHGRFVAGTTAHSEHGQHGGPVRIWELETGREFASLPTGGKPGYGCVWDAASELVAAVFSDQSIVAWDVVTQRPRWQVESDTDFVPLRHPASGELYLLEQDNPLRAMRCQVLDFRSGTVKRRFVADRNNIIPRRFSPDGRLILAAYLDTKPAGSDTGIVLLDSRDGRVVEEWSAGLGWQVVGDLFMARSGARLFSISGPGEILVWDRHTREVVINLRDPRLDFHQLTLTADDLLVAGTFSGSGFYLLDGRPIREGRPARPALTAAAHSAE
jgi:WD40 repeat protein/predicted Ser/Thr protein kinase